MGYPEAMLSVIGYARLSRDTLESTSIERQREAIAAAAVARGYNLIDIVMETDTSATKMRLDRPGLHAVRKAIAEGRASAVLVYRLDRLARNVVDFGTLLDEGVNVVSANEPLDTTTPMGRAMAEILQVFAAMEARTIGERVRSSRHYLPTVGRFPGGTPGYGLRPAPHPTGVGRTLVEDETEGPVARRIIAELLAGENASAIARRLNEEGVPTRAATSGKNPASVWRTSTIRTVATSGHLQGHAVANGAIVRGEDGVARVLFPAFVDADEAAVLDAMFKPSTTADLSERIKAGRKKASSMLSGIATCASCGHYLTARHVNREDIPAELTCMSRNRGLGCPAPTRAAMARVEEVVVAEFLRLFGDLEVTRRIERRGDRTRLAEVVAALEATTDAMRAPGSDVMALASKVARLSHEREALEAEVPEVIIEIIWTGKTVAEVWDTSDYLGRRSLLLDMGTSVMLARQTKRMGPKFDPSRVAVTFGAEHTEHIDEDDLHMPSPGPGKGPRKAPRGRRVSAG